MLLHDSVSVSAVRRTTDGYLVAEARVARTGIQDYLGTEVMAKWHLEGDKLD